MTTDVVAVTGKVVTGKLLSYVPAATVTFSGTVAIAILLLDKYTSAPFEGAKPVRITRPVKGSPPVADPTSSKDFTRGGNTDNHCVWVMGARYAEISMIPKTGASNG
jgi:hypothetical protein